MDISLPVSEGPVAAAFSAGGSSRSADNGKFSQTLSKEMSDTPHKDAVADQPENSQQAHVKSGTAESAKQNGRADRPEKSDDTAAEKAAETPSESSEHVAATGKSARKTTQQIGDDSPVNTDANQTAVISTEEKSVLESLQLLAGKGEHTQAETVDKTVTPAAPGKATDTAANSALANGSTNPALLRSNAIHNEIFTSVRLQRPEASVTEAGDNVETLLSGKASHNSGKNLPGSGKAEKSENIFNSFLSAGAQDGKNPTDSLIPAVGEKSAKFDAFTMQFDAKSAESFSIINAGPGKSMLAPQAGLKTELANPALEYTSLTSEFLAGSEEWCQDFGTKIEWLNNENITKAELSLHPAELGALDITINTEDDRISINIVTHSEKSREMLESSMPRLNELLKSQGLALENSNISHNSASDRQHAQQSQQGSAFSLNAEEQQVAEAGVVRSALIRHQGQIDHYV